MKDQTEKIKIAMTLSLIILTMIGCSSSKNAELIQDHVFKSNTAIKISSENFSKLLNKSSEGLSYSGFGILTDIRGRGIEGIHPEFKEILYDPTDSILFVHGFLYDTQNPRKAFSKAQVILGKISKSHEGNNYSSIIFFNNYLVNNNGEFSITYKLSERNQIIIASREVYKENGEYEYTPICFIKAYDVYKLLDANFERIFK